MQNIVHNFLYEPEIPPTPEEVGDTLRRLDALNERFKKAQNNGEKALLHRQAEPLVRGLPVDVQRYVRLRLASSIN